MYVRRVGAVVGAIVLIGMAGTARAEDPVSKPVPAAPSRPPNRLATERSPYLRQHMHNPVDWRPWGPEAFSAARTSGKLVFLSIGYAACHWCHVMEHESFEDEATAAVLNEAFVCIKVDREERPDVDDVYMAAVQMTTGRGGWPMSCFLLPDGRPFLARTYMRPQDLVNVTTQILALQKSDPARLTAAAEEIANGVRENVGGPKVPPFEGADDELVRFAVDRIASEFDDRFGGFDRSPKFPPHATLLFLLDRDGKAAGERGLLMATKTLDGMAAGGVHDQIGGGFHRYSTDGEWFLPHFEKMLYDNALLATAYAKGFAVTKRAAYARVVRDVLAWIEREMAVEGGGYASSLDADTAGEEGLTYTWTIDELRAELAPADVALAVEVYGAKPEGNAHDEASGRPTGRNILHLAVPLEDVAKRRGVTVATLEADLDRVRATLLPIRVKRVQPGRDGKVLTGWNGLLLSAYATAGAALGDATYLVRARALATFLLEQSMDDGRLLRFPKASGPKIPGFLDDHAHLADGLLDLAGATGEASWADAAGRLADAIVARFTDPAGGFFSSSTDHETLLARSKDAFDSPIPSGNATAARVLQRLFVRTGDVARREAADRVLGPYRALAARAPTAAMALVRAIADRVVIANGGAAPEAGDVTVRRGVATIDVFLERGEAKPGTTVRAAIRVTLASGWHVNAAKASKPELIATLLASAEKSPVAMGAVEYPTPTTLAGAKPTDAVSVYEGTFWLRTTLSIPADAVTGPRRVPLVLTFQPCDAATCKLPEEVRLEVPLRFGDDGPARRPAVFR